ncbi:hypothetical protein HOY82DRAFT_88907 [Tuber indicum]|nr:hypothetical protein HOY82DRAFT_88907 [Tuber indicum]
MPPHHLVVLLGITSHACLPIPWRTWPSGKKKAVLNKLELEKTPVKLQRSFSATACGVSRVAFAKIKAWDLAPHTTERDEQI